ncbi:hemolymph lipopolysaccharide-binding protein-like isoform X2 [Biomphalaria glabrata]|uniref:Hemolymph lipopolysaccharide-binding protein-like isoform X2 n=1 Tax=Biomphalaria glabrata TaxID=6526 RepID=A0A9W3AAD6_BIOGL|nr:hemolymph lipopolysaccharide-binding protein-like isoform X2 [Biomphalaria glabrata]
MFSSILVLILYATVIGGQAPPIDTFDPAHDQCGTGFFSDFKIEKEGDVVMCLRWSSWPNTFAGAKKYCLIRGTRLGVFNTWDKMKILQRQNNVTFVGLDDLQTEGKFIWHNGEQLENPRSSGFFNLNEPSNSEGVEDCVVLQGRLLNDVPCTMSYLFVCELEL